MSRIEGSGNFRRVKDILERGNSMKKDLREIIVRLGHWGCGKDWDGGNDHPMNVVLPREELHAEAIR